MKYSVLISLYDGENPNYVKPSLDSMINQTVQPSEIVLVLDGPINNRLQNIVDDYKNKFPNIMKIISLKENLGLGLALNVGLENCSNELIARMDTDDISLPTRCEKQLRAFKEIPELSIVGSNTDEFSTSPTEIKSSRVVPSVHSEIVKFSKTRNPFNHPTVMYRKSTLIETGGYGNYRRNQDYELFVRMLNEGHKAMNIDESLLLFRANDDNLKRRKSWNKTKGDISIRYNFWKKGYIDFSDFLISTVAFLSAYILPNKVFELITSRFLRNTE